MSRTLHHPFRAPVTSGVAQSSYEKSSASTPSENADVSNINANGFYAESDEDALKRAQFKTRVAIGAGVLLILGVIIYSGISEISSSFETSDYSSDVDHKKRDKRPERRTNYSSPDAALEGDAKDLSDARERAREKQGFFSGLFCNGRVKSRFCDE